MPIWRSVDVYPNGGFPDGHWQRDPDYDAFARSAQRVTAAMSAALPALELPLKGCSHLRLFATSDVGKPNKPSQGQPASVTVHLGSYDEFYGGHVDVPTGVASLSPEARGLLALDVLCVAGAQLASQGGWDPSALDAARQTVIESGLEFRWDGPWKSSPDRKVKARLTYRIADDGHGRARLEVSDGAETRTSPEVHCPRGYRHIAKQLRWEGSTGFSVPGLGPHPAPPPPESSPEERAKLLLRATASTHFRVDGLEPNPVPLVGPIDPTAARPAVVQAVPPGQPETRIEHPHVYGLGQVDTPLWSAVREALRPLESAEWQTWWSQNGSGVLDIEVELGSWTEKRSLVVRKQKDGVIARLKVPHTDLPGRESEYVPFARDETRALLAKVQDRAGGAPHPELPEPTINWDEVRQHEAHAKRRDAESAAFLIEVWRQAEAESAPGEDTR